MMPVTRTISGTRPVPEAGDIFGEMVGRREADIGKQEERGGDAKVRRIKNMLGMAVAHGGAQNDFRADGKNDGEDHRPEPFVGIKQHAAGKSRNEASRKKIQKIAKAAGKAQFAVLGAGIDPIQEH